MILYIFNFTTLKINYEYYNIQYKIYSMFKILNTRRLFGENLKYDLMSDEDRQEIDNHNKKLIKNIIEFINKSKYDRAMNLYINLGFELPIGQVRLDLLDKIDVVKLNKLEAEALSLKKIENESDIKDIAISLHNKGLKKSLISWGSKLFVCERSKVIKYEHFGLRENPVNVTGAGDSLIGNYVYALSKGQNEDDAVAFGLSAAILTVDVMSAVRDLTKEMIIKNIKTLNIQKGEL